MKLAINGGKPVRDKKLLPFPNIDKSDLLSVVKCFYDNSFSAFRAGTYEGGSRVVQFENTVKDRMACDYAVSFDTWSNGIVAVMMALGLEPGDEVIVTPYTMTSCATSILACGAIPIFADVREDTGCIDADDIKRKITDKTRAIFVVHLFGLPADMDSIKSIADEKGIFIFEDCAQSPLAEYKGRLVGTIGDAGGFSFTESKHVMSGEGGIAITNDVKINNALRVIRNHGEVCRTEFSGESYADDVYNPGLIGYNFRMSELTASLADSQWKKLDSIIEEKQELASHLIESLSRFDFIEKMTPEYDHKPAWYQLPLRYIESKTGVPRDKFIAALNAEGLNFAGGYVTPLYYQNIYRNNKHWVLKEFAPNVDYYENSCPVVERLWKKELITTLDIRKPYTADDMKDIIRAFEKVDNNLDELR